MTNVKDFLNELKENDTKVLNYNDFLNELKNTPERDITGTLKTNILTPKKGLISIDTFLDNLFTYEKQGHFLSSSEIKKLKSNTNYTYENERYTYNEKPSYLTHDIKMKMFVNDDDNYLLFLQIHTGLDERYGFSSYVVIKFNTKNDYYNAFFFDNTDYLLASCSAKTEDGTKLSIEVTSRPFGDIADMFVMNENTMEDIFETEVYGTGLDSIKDIVNDYISNDKELSKKYHIKEFTDYNGTVKTNY